MRFPDFGKFPNPSPDYLARFPVLKISIFGE
jgi:hypothetical protein